MPNGNLGWLAIWKLCVDKRCLWGISYHKPKHLFSNFIKSKRNSFKGLNTTLFPLNMLFAFAKIYRVLFAGKSVKQIYRFTDKFSVKAQPYCQSYKKFCYTIKYRQQK
jgi:hypothetical protein